MLESGFLEIFANRVAALAHAYAHVPRRRQFGQQHLRRLGLGFAERITIFRWSAIPRSILSSAELLK